jgi:hypothetical protein
VAASGHVWTRAWPGRRRPRFPDAASRSASLGSARRNPLLRRELFQFLLNGLLSRTAGALVGPEPRGCGHQGGQWVLPAYYCAKQSLNSLKTLLHMNGSEIVRPGTRVHVRVWATGMARGRVAFAAHLSRTRHMRHASRGICPSPRPSPTCEHARARGVVAAALPASWACAAAAATAAASGPRRRPAGADKARLSCRRHTIPSVLKVKHTPQTLIRYRPRI